MNNEWKYSGPLDMVQGVMVCSGGSVFVVIGLFSVGVSL